MISIRKLFFAFVLLIVSLFQSYGQCSLNNIFGEFDIPDNSDTCLMVTFSGVVNDDLSLNSLFNGIDIEFEHDAVSDLVIDLTSPFGQTITIVGDIDGSGSLTTGAEWNVIFTECSGSANPDSGISDTWDNTEPWVAFGNYSGIYYPSGGCFEGFNQGSINGTWTLCFRDGIQFNTGHVTRVGFALTGVNGMTNCNQCSAEAGDQSVSNIQVCTNDDLNLDLGLISENVDSDYALLYLVSQNDVLTTINLDGDFVGLAAGIYDICAVSIKEDELLSFINSSFTYQEIVDGISAGILPFCIDIADNCTVLELVQSPTVQVINQTICLGENVDIGGEIFSMAGTFPAVLHKSGADLCDTSVVLNLEVISIQPAIQATSNEFTCSISTITLDASGSVQEMGSTFLWLTNNGQITGDPTANTIQITESGTYVLEQSENGCTLQTFINIGEANDIPQVNITSPQLSCNADEVMLIVSSSSTITAATWTGPAGFTSSVVQPIVNVAGRYEAILTDNAGCSISVNYDLGQASDLPLINASAPNLSCSAASVQISVSNNNFNTYRWTGPQGFVSNIAEPQVTSTGSYFLEVTDVSGCKGFTSVEVLGDVGTFEYEVSGGTFLCNGGAVAISASSEASNAVYSWTGPNNYFSSSPTNSVTAEGTYIVEIITNGCVVIDSVTLERDISDLPEYDVEVENIGNCENPVWRLTAIPLANEFQTARVRWVRSGVAILGSGNSIDVSSSGSYYLLINTFNGCVVTKAFIIEALPAAPSVSLVSKSQVNCARGLGSGILGVTENPDYSYEWSSPTYPTFTEDTSRIENLEAGFYDLTITDIISGCVSFYSDRIVADTIPRIVSIRNTNIDCIDPQANIILTANGGGNTYEWTGPEGSFATKDISVLTAGEYFVTITGGNGCITLDTAFVLQDTDPPALAISDGELECETQSLQLDLGNDEAGVTFHWTGPTDFETTAANPVIFATGDYNVTLTGLNGCTSETSISISANSNTPVPLASVNDTLTCINTEVMIFSEVSVPVVSFSWDGPGSYLSSEQTPLVSIPGVYVVTVESTLGCIGFDTIEVIQEIILPEITYAFEQTVNCIDISAQLTGMSDDSGATFSWTGPNGFQSEDQFATALDTGTYIYSVRGTNNCVASDTFQIGIEEISFTSNLTTNCYEPGLDISELSDSLSYSIAWSAGPNGFTSNELSPRPLDQGDYVASVIGSNGCLATVNLSVMLDTLNPAVGSQQIGLIRCEENIIQLDASGSSQGDQYAYSWNSLDGTVLMGSDSFTSQIQGIGSYELTVIDSLNGCTNVLTTIVEEAETEFIGIEFANEDPRCFGENNGSVMFISSNGGTAPYSYSIDGVFFTSDPIIGDLAPGSYTYVVKDSFGCLMQEDFAISDPEALELDLGENIDVFLGNEVEINASTNLTMDQIESIRWQIENTLGCADCLSFTLTPDKDILIELTLMNERGCSIADEVKVRVDQEPVLFKPNIFSPNEDGFNDVFFIFANPGVAQFKSLSIFDRWGNKVFFNTNFSPGDISSGWDGRFQGQILQSGVYVYKLEVEMINGITRTQNGSVTLFK